MYRLENTERSAMYLLRNGSYEYSYNNVSGDELEKYKLWLQQNLYVEYDTANWDGNSFSTFVSADEQINIAYYPRMSGGTLKVMTERRGFLPLTVAPKYKKLMDATVTQLGREGASRVAAGESFVVQLEDGSFVIIDGGPHNDHDTAELLTFLRKYGII